MTDKAWNRLKESGYKIWKNDDPWWYPARYTVTHDGTVLCCTGTLRVARKKIAEHKNRPGPFWEVEKIVHEEK